MKDLKKKRNIAIALLVSVSTVWASLHGLAEQHHLVRFWILGALIIGFLLTDVMNTMRRLWALDDASDGQLQSEAKSSDVVALPEPDGPELTSALAFPISAPVPAAAATEFDAAVTKAVERGVDLLKLCQRLQSEKDGIDRPEPGSFDKAKTIDQFTIDVMESISYMTALYSLLAMKRRLSDFGRELEHQGKLSSSRVLGGGYAQSALEFLLAQYAKNNP